MHVLTSTTSRKGPMDSDEQGGLRLRWKENALHLPHLPCIVQYQLSQSQPGFDKLGAFRIHCLSSVSCNSHAAMLFRLTNMPSVPSPNILALTSLASPLVRFGTLETVSLQRRTFGYHTKTNLNTVHSISGGNAAVVLLNPLISS